MQRNLDASMIAVMQIHLSEPEGDILLFLIGETRTRLAESLLHPVLCSSHAAKLAGMQGNASKS
jgi:HrpA-like RNA helicase